MKVNKDLIISNYMSKLGITKEQAEELFLYDASLADSDVKGVRPSTCPEADALTAKAKTLPRYYERTIKDTPKKRKTTKKAPNDIKLAFITTAADALKANTSVTIKNIEADKEIKFTYCDKPYTLKLTKHNSYVGIKEAKSTKRKVDVAKALLINTVADALSMNFNVENLLIQTETKVNFNYETINYTFALTANRK